MTADALVSSMIKVALVVSLILPFAVSGQSSSDQDLDHVSSLDASTSNGSTLHSADSIPLRDSKKNPDASDHVEMGEVVCPGLSSNQP